MTMNTGFSPRIIWYVRVHVHSLLFREPLAFGPWLFNSRALVDAFLYRLFAPPLVAWAQRRLLEWPQGCVDPPSEERLELLRDHRMLEQLHDFYRTEKDKNGLNYWTWTVESYPMTTEGENVAADAFLKHMGSEFSDFQ